MDKISLPVRDRRSRGLGIGSKTRPHKHLLWRVFSSTWVGLYMPRPDQILNFGCFGIRDLRELFGVLRILQADINYGMDGAIDSQIGVVLKAILIK